MTNSTIGTIAANFTSDEVQKWSSVAGKFAVEGILEINERMKKACAECPFHGRVPTDCCLECPVYAVRYAAKQVAPRVANAVKKIYQRKYSHKAA